mgnify:CR=1 FL=1
MNHIFHKSKSKNICYNIVLFDSSFSKVFLIMKCYIVMENVSMDPIYITSASYITPVYFGNLFDIALWIPTLKINATKKSILTSIQTLKLTDIQENPEQRYNSI